MSKKSKLLQENRARAYREANDAIGAARAQLDALVPCECGQALVHTRECPRWKVGATIVHVYNTAHVAGQCREREKVRGRLLSILRATWAERVRGLERAVDAIERMRFPR